MGCDKNTKLITLDNVAIGGEEFCVTSKEKKEIDFDKYVLINKRFGGFVEYDRLCHRNFGKDFREVEKEFCKKLNDNQEYLLKTESDYNKLLDAIWYEVSMKELKADFIMVICVIVLLFLAIKFWYIAIGILLAVFFARAFAIIRF